MTDYNSTGVNNFSWTKALGFGALIWLIMFAVSSAIAGYGISMGIGVSIALVVLVAVLAYLFALGLKSEDSAQAFEYGVVFAAVGILLDYVISARFAPGIFATWAYWIGYALVVVAPFAQHEMQGAGAHPKAL